MFKRLKRKLDRKVEEEELGLDGEVKEALGLDSDDSDSSSDSDADSEDIGESEELSNMVLDDLDEERSDAQSGDGSEVGTEASEHEIVEHSSDDDGPPVPLHLVADNPLYEDSGKVRCILCAGKDLGVDNQKVQDVHLSSKVHKKNLQRFKTYIGKVSSLDKIATHDTREVMRLIERDLFENTPAKGKSRKMEKIAEFRRGKREAQRLRAARRRIQTSETTPSGPKVVTSSKTKSSQTGSSPTKSGKSSHISTPQSPSKKSKLKIAEEISSSKVKRGHQPDKTSSRGLKGRYFGKAITESKKGHEKVPMRGPNLKVYS